MKITENGYSSLATVKCLQKQIQHGLKVSGLGFSKITPRSNCLLIDTTEEIEVAEALARYPGVDYAAVVENTSSNFNDVVKLVTKVGRAVVFPDESFRVVVSIETQLDYVSRDVEVAATSKLTEELAQRGARPDEEKPSKTIYVKIYENEAYVFNFQYDGPGGLPVGSNGRAVCLLTGERRSGVASWLAVRMGLAPHFLIYDLRPSTHYLQLQSALSIALRLKERIPSKVLELSIVKQKDVVERLKNASPIGAFPIILRRLLIRIACLYAERLQFDAIVTGDGFSKDPYWLLEYLNDNARNLEKNLILPTLALTTREIETHSKILELSGEDLYQTLNVRRGMRKIPLSRIQEIESSAGIDTYIEDALNNIRRIRLDVKTVNLHKLLNLLR